jgi:hypothetical protein
MHDQNLRRTYGYLDGDFVTLEDIDRVECPRHRSASKVEVRDRSTATFLDRVLPLVIK